MRTTLLALIAAFVLAGCPDNKKEDASKDKAEGTAKPAESAAADKPAKTDSEAGGEEEGGW